MLAFDPRERIMVALDCTPDEARRVAAQLAGHATWLKVGMTLYYAAGAPLVEELGTAGFKVFLDLKLHDIPHQVRGAAEAAALAGADMLTIHTLGGAAMAEAARAGVDAAAARSGKHTSLIGVTVLTSQDAHSLAEVGITDTPAAEVERLARLGVAHGLDGLVCSPLEAERVRALVGAEPLIVTPGVRLTVGEHHDQARVATPAAAFAAGATHIVVGRPILQADDRARAFEDIVAASEYTYNS